MIIVYAIIRCRKICGWTLCQYGADRCVFMGENVMAMPLVSVYCMTYNHEKTIAQTIESIVQQKTDFAFELIVHDDASTDNTAAIVCEYAQKYPDIVRPIFQTENQFRNCNLIRAFMHPVSQGKYIAICEGDDYWTDPEKLQKQVAYMQEDKTCTMCFHAVQQLSSDGTFINYRPLKETGVVDTDTIIKRGGMFCPSVSLMLRRDVMDVWPRFREVADVYDYPTQLLAATMGTVRYMDSMMGVYRFASEGSWTQAHADTVNYAHVENEETWLQLFDEYTQGKHTAAITYHMAHMWLTEYRKCFDKTVRKTAKQYIRRLAWRDKCVFGVLLCMFAVLGRRGNVLFEALKKRILK